MARLDLDAIMTAAPTMTNDEKRLACKRIAREQREDLHAMFAAWDRLETWERVDPASFWREASTDEGLAGLKMIQAAFQLVYATLTGEGEADEVAHE